MTFINHRKYLFHTDGSRNLNTLTLSFPANGIVKLDPNYCAHLF